MQRFATALVLLLVVTGAQGQDFKKFKAGIGIGYGLPSDGEGGILVYIEPMYRLKDNIAVGLRLESAAFLGQPISGTSYTTSAFGIGSYTASGQYYFGSGTFRPFVGAGLGLYSLAAVSSDIGGSNAQLTAAASVFGFYPRIGFDLGHFNLLIDYNLIPEQTTTVTSGGFGTTTTTSNYSYIGVKLGASIGGGKN